MLQVARIAALKDRFPVVSAIAIALVHTATSGPIKISISRKCRRRPRNSEAAAARRHIKNSRLRTGGRKTFIRTASLMGRQRKARSTFKIFPVSRRSSDSSHLSSHLSPKSPVFTMPQWTTRRRRHAATDRLRAVGQCHVVLPPSTGWMDGAVSCPVSSVSKKAAVKEATMSANSA